MNRIILLQPKQSHGNKFDQRAELLAELLRLIAPNTQEGVLRGGSAAVEA